MPELDINQPSTRQLQQLIKEKNKIEIKLLTGDVFSGEMFWQDPDYFCLNQADGSKYIICKTSVVYIRPL